MKGLSIRSEEQELQAALTERRRPVLPMNSWPGDAVYYEYLRWLDQNPEVQDWSMGRVENARRVVRLLHAVVNCVEAKLVKQQAATAGNETPSDLQHDHQMGQQEDAPSIKNRGRLWGLVRKHLFKNRDEKRSRMQNERQAARNCFQTLTHSEKIIHAARDSGLLRELIEELGFAALGWDLSSGNLSKSAVEKIRDTLSQLKSNPQLQQVLEDLGRLEKTAHDDRTSRLADFIEACTQTRKVLRDHVVLGVVMDVTGIDQSDHIDLMLSDELAFLALPQLRAVWCQRFIESQLTTWKVQGTDVEQLEVPIQAKHSQGSPVRSGPLIALLDTSGSMAAGIREPMAKALVLLLCQIAQRLSRRIFVISFSGPGQTLDFEFTPNADGLHRLAEFLQWNFHGGTDIDAPLQRSLQKCLLDTTWSTADIAIISDGDYHLSPHTVQLVADCRNKRGLNVSALLIEGCSDASQKICSPSDIHRLKNWNAVRKYK